jgi:hypothetical protein
VIFLVDASNREQWPAARQQLHAMVAAAPSIPVAVVGNKIDIPSSGTVDEMQIALGLFPSGGIITYPTFQQYGASSLGPVPPLSHWQYAPPHVLPPPHTPGSPPAGTRRARGSAPACYALSAASSLGPSTERQANATMRLAAQLGLHCRWRYRQRTGMERAARVCQWYGRPPAPRCTWRAPPAGMATAKQ